MKQECYGQPIHVPENYIRTAKKLLNEDPIFLNTKTTGFGETAEIVEIAIIDINGTPLLETFINPYNPIPREAIIVHGITNDMVKDAPYWSEIHGQFCQIIKDRIVIIYNRYYDVRLIDQTIKASIENKALEETAENWYKGQRILCAMKLYAAYYGQWDNNRENWKRQKLTAAADQMKVQVDGKPHRAVTDCLMTLGVLQAMGEQDIQISLSKEEGKKMTIKSILEKKGYDSDFIYSLAEELVDSMMNTNPVPRNLEPRQYMVMAAAATAASILSQVKIEQLMTE